MTVAERWEKVRESVADAAQRSGRSEDAVRVLAVTKTLDADTVLEGVEAGLRRFGENYFQEAPEKIETVRNRVPDLADSLEWHYIGQLQSNKVRKVLEHFQVIQSLDRAKLINRADRIAGEMGLVARGLIQVSVTDKDTQGGISIDDWPALVSLAEKASGRDHLRIEGLMTIGPLTDDETELHRAFAQVRETAGRLAELNLPGLTMDTLSMGMSNDYQVAIEEGATLVRIGTAIFGPRNA